MLLAALQMRRCNSCKYVVVYKLLFQGVEDDISSHFNRSTICNLMQNSDIVNRICKNLNVDDLKHIYEVC